MPAEPPRVRVDVRPLFFSRPLLVEAFFIEWKGAPMWGGKKLRNVETPALVQIDSTRFAAVTKGLRSPLLEIVGANQNWVIARIMSTHIYPPEDADRSSWCLPSEIDGTEEIDDANRTRE